MKDTLNTTYKLKERLLAKWRSFSYLVGKEEQDDRTIELQEEAIKEIEKLLPFKDEEEHEHWLDVLQGFKFWEDFEDLTMEIMNRELKPKNIENKQLLDSYYQVAKDVCEDANFYDLFRVFASLSNGWVKPMSEWNAYYKSMANDEWMMGCFHEIYRETFGKQYQLKDLLEKNYYGFEDTPNCMFFKNDVESKSDLIDCIFDRYVDGFDEDEQLWFYQRLIKELI